MTPSQKELQLKMNVTANPGEGVRALQQIAAEAQKAEQAVSRVIRALGGSTGGAGGSLGGAGPQSAGPGRTLPPMSSAVPVFDRPIPVIIVGPKPLPVVGTAGPGGTGSSGAAGNGAPPGTAEKLLGIIRNLGLGGVAGYAGQIEGYGQAAGDAARMLGFKKAGAGIEKFAGRAAVPLALALGAAKAAGEYGEIAHDTFMTGDQQNRALFRKFVPFGETIQGSVDGISGRKAAYERADLASRQRAAEASGRVDVAGTMVGLNPELAGHSARAGLLGGASPILEGASDRSTAMGETAFRDRQRMLPLERESAKAEREAAVATAQRVSAGTELVKVENRMAELQNKRSKLQRELEQHGSGAGRQRVLHQLSETENELQGMGGVQRQARMGVYQSAQQEAEARRAAGMVGVRKLQAEASGLEEDAAAAAGGARQLGGMGRSKRMDGVNALRRLQTYGPELVGQADLAAAQAIAPQTVGKILERHGAGTAEFATLRDLAPADFAGDPEELRKKAAAKRDEATKKELDLEREAARAGDAAGRDLGAAMSTMMKTLVESAKREMHNQLLLGKNAS